MDSSVVVLARKKDLDIVKQSADAAAKSYKEISGRSLQFDVEATLSDDGCVDILY